MTAGGGGQAAWVAAIDALQPQPATGHFSSKAQS
jgi:hypothetical protein